MSKPSDIPQDVWDAARHAYEELFRLGTYRGAGVVVEPQAVIARAIMAERARCAALLDDEASAMRDQRDEMITHGTLGGRLLPETVKKLALIERRALFEGYATMAEAIRKGTP